MIDQPFDLTTWKARVRAWWQEAARDLPGTARRLGVRSAYGLLTASAWLPLLEHYVPESPGSAVAALSLATAGVGSSLVSNLVQGAYDRAGAPRKTEQEVRQDETLRAEHCHLVESLEARAAAQAALGKRWEAFLEQLCREDRELGGALQINSEGGAVFMGSVDNRRGVLARDLSVERDWVQGDKWQIILGNYFDRAPDEVPAETLLQAYLGSLAAECSRLPLGVVDPRFVSASSETPVPLDQVYVDLDVLSLPKDAETEGGRAWMGRLVRGEGGERTALLEALGRPAGSHVVLLGDPGSGKTTFVNYLSFALASDPEGSGLDALSGLLPIRFVLRDVAARCIPSDAQRGDAAMLWAALRADLAARLGNDAAVVLTPWLQRRLLQRGGLLMLDGLDEVPDSDRRRRCLLQAVFDLSAQLPVQSRVLVTARPYAYVDPRWHLAGFETLILAPFDERQVRRFVECWYEAVRPAMGWDEATARERGQRLLSGLEERPCLADLSARPLLLTLMATLHTSWGQLPEDRAELYEETVKLLLSRWQRAWEARDETGATVIEPGIARALEVEEGVVLTALHRLAYDVHLRQRSDGGSGEGREGDGGPADIAEGEVLAAFAPLLPQNFNPSLLLRYLETRAGLLIGREPGVYTFPHRSFQEYLAACFLADGIDFSRELCRHARQDVDWWRQVFLLGVGKARQGGLGNALGIIHLLLPEDPDKVEDSGDVDWQMALLAGQALLDLRFPGVARGQPDLEATLRRVRHWLVALLSTPDVLAPRERAQAGNLLGRLGDPRPGVGTIADKTRVYAGGEGEAVPDLLWCRVPAGSFLMGSTGQEAGVYPDEQPLHALDLPGFYIARYPITNAQYRPFVEGGGYADARYWTDEGWAWRNGAEADLSAIDDDSLKKSYEDWLARRPKGRRDQPYWWDDPRLGLPNCPVVGVTWYEAMAYCAWLEHRVGERASGRRTWTAWRDVKGHGIELRGARFAVRLPSEAEWEKAARGSLGRTWPWEGEWIAGRANTKETGIGQTSAVGCFPAGTGPYGALDLAGNVWEWTRSRWGGYSSGPDFRYPYDPADGREDLAACGARVLRGGSWFDPFRNARCAYRSRNHPDLWLSDVGFRACLCLDLEDGD